MFLKNCWYVAAWDHELIDGKLLARTILEEAGGALQGRERPGGRARQPLLPPRREALQRAGSRATACAACTTASSSTRSGKCIQIPGQDIIPPKLGVRSYPVVERDHLVWIWMGDPAQADPAQIVDFPYLRDPAWRGMPDYMHYDANYLLIVDNLSDFAHLAFVHTKTLGGSEEYAYKTKPIAIERLDDGFRVERWHMNADAAAVPQEGASRDKAGKVDRRNIGAHVRAGHLLPGVAVRAGRLGRGEGQPAPARSSTATASSSRPETRRSTHFFWNYLHDYELHDPTIALSLHNSMVEGFIEDKFIIEGQQEVLDADPDFKMNGIVADAPLAHFRRTLSKRIEMEQQQSQPAAA